MSFFAGIGGWFMNLLTGGTLDSILRTIEKGMDDEVQKEHVKAEVTRKWIDAQASLLVGRTWWFQLFFIIPLGMWWTAVMLDTIFHMPWDVASLPAPLDEWAAWIIGALFLVDGTKAVLGRAKK